jgi:hypothetical protein
VPSPPADAEEIDLSIDFTEIQNLKYKTSGEFANVYGGVYKGTPVAVKILKDQYLFDARAKGDFGEHSNDQILTPPSPNPPPAPSALRIREEGSGPVHGEHGEHREGAFHPNP